MRLFGWQFTKTPSTTDLSSFAPEETDDGALVVTAGGTYGTYLDMEGAAKTEAELVVKYREMALQPELEKALDEVVNEAIVKEGNNKILELNLDDIPEFSDTIKKIITDEFEVICKLLNFNNYGYEIFRRWYVDGRLYYHVIIDNNDPEKGIQELRYVDPRKIRKVRLLTRERKGQVYVNRNTAEFFVYNEKGFKATGSTGMDNNGLKIAPDAILHVTSGLMDKDGKLVLSYLHRSIKPLNQLRMLEDATVIYRISRASERRVFYIDVGQMPKIKAEQYMRDMMVKHKNRLIYDASTGSVKDDRRFMCYTLDTKVPLLDGRTLTIEEIIQEFNQNKLNWVYSCDPITGKFVPGPITWAGITKRNSKVVRVTFDNGKSVTCTPDHKFPVWNKGFIEAQNLTIGESLIPGYRRQKEITSDGVTYEQIYKNETGTWEFTHREVANWKKELGIMDEMIHDSKYTDAPKTVIHHKNFDRYDNSPENLVMMNHKDHMNYHHDIQSIDYTSDILSAVYNCAKNILSIESTVEFVNSTCNISEWRELNKNKNIKNRNIHDMTFTHKDLSRICKLHGHYSWAKYKKIYDNRDRESNSRVRRGKNVWGSEGHKALRSEIFKKYPNPNLKSWKVWDKDGNELIIENLNEYCREHGLNRSNIKGKYGSKGYRAEILRNHKVVSVEFLSDLYDVAALSIDNEETYHSHHTYLLDAGVYTKNTLTEDYWLPRREGQNGTEITTLPAGENLGKMEDVFYFEKKLYQSLNVPISRINSDESTFNLGRTSEITRDEISFQKYIDRIRLKFSTLLLEALEKQLILKKIFAQSDWDEIKDRIHFDYARDNYFAELKDAEILMNRVNVLTMMEPFLGRFWSDEWVKRNVLMQTDNDIEEMEEQMEEDVDKQQDRAQKMVNAGLAPDGSILPPEYMEPPEPTTGPTNNAPTKKPSQLNPTKTETVQGKKGPYERKEPKKPQNK